MEDDVSTISSFLQSPTNSLKDDRFSPQSTAHFFGGCNGHGGSQILLFRHELKSKRIKKIKSTTYHRLKNKDLKNSSLGALMDPEMAKEEAVRQEAKRVEERMTLKHKNTGKWAKRMLSRGLNVKYDGTKAAIAEQLQMNANLSRKMNSMRDGSNSDERDDEEELRDGSDEDAPSRLIAKAKEKTLKALEDGELPNAVLMSLPFMKNEEANEEAKRALEEYEEWENSDGENSEKAVNVSGRRVFGATAKVEAPKESSKDSDNFYDDSDSDNDMAGIEDNNIEPVRDNASPARNTITETEVSYFFIMDEESEDSESEAEQMVDRVLTSASKETFVVPSQAELINRAFAGDDVLDEFEKDKDEVLNQKVPIYTYIRYLCLSTHNL
ncbi:unnamed protein product [Brassica napus]|uniref:(rape) hypothetical protein n=1 Tax=Brassica napus TaxID=3708 RepID=A0A816UN57_BRANA|nr:unnamed protein product [Brassica napus]